MKQKNTVLLWSHLLMLLAVQTHAQSSVNTSGGIATGTAGSMSYSVGQLMYNTHIGASGVVTEGVQQSETTNSPTLSIVPLEKIAKIAAYPNPAISYLKLDVQELELSNLKYRIADLQGKTVSIVDIKEAKTDIPMQRLTPSTYFVSIQKNNKTIKTFKIIKN
ncbi:T9SS type A sorting domain-containing protein [Wenyingzhuangia sp. IMCC45533]